MQRLHVKSSSFQGCSYFGKSDCAALSQLCALSCRIADILSGKGGGKGGKFQGKCQKLENRGAVEQLLRETMEK